MRKVLAICAGALAFRLALLAFIDHPGIADPNHYYNLAVRLVEGRGFTLDYIWQYNQPPPSLEHPETHWMPLTAVLAAGSMGALGRTARAAILPFAVLASLLPALSYWGARQLNLKPNIALFSAAAVAVLPELTVYSLRTDTVVPFSVFTCLCILLFNQGVARGGLLPFIGSGVAAGLAYLTRNDGVLLLPMLAFTAWAYSVDRRQAAAPPWRGAAVAALMGMVVVTPWLIRNLDAAGTLASPEIDDMFFLTDHNDHYAFGRHFTLQTMLAAQTPAQWIGKRLFELAAAVKVMFQSLAGGLEVAVAGGVLLLLGERDRRRLLTLAPLLFLVAGLLIAYPLLIPYKAQAGSFKKAFVAALPLIVPIGAYAMERAIGDGRLRLGAMALVIALALAQAVDAVRLEARFNARYLGQTERVVGVARALPDTNRDGEIILMAQDPYVLRYAGLRSIMFPSESRDLVIGIAKRYAVDYLLMPADRPSLDPVFTGEVADPRFIRVADVPGTSYVFYRIED